ncbi:MAG: flavocytochrome c [Oscillatoria sp. PMC 1051.18]|nr:flavocytochrome c [Oscillatoria sp. PMC 1050.18]MEC5028591.1 flavocytochrome c [Oscillatoria sp. PMC 1051.18]
MSKTSWDESTDVIVIGSGFAGLAAAIEAAQAGCSVIVLEKRDSCGGNSWISGGALAAVDVVMQRRHGVVDSTRLMFEDMMRAGRTNDPELVRLVCTHSFEVLQWLRQDFGIEFMDRLEQLGGHSVPRCHSVEEIQGRNIINPMLERAASLKVDIRLNTCMEEIYQTSQGTAIAVRASLVSTPDRAESLTIKAKKAIILASGGFSGEAAGKDALRTSLSDSTSETLRIAERAGAALIDMEHLQMLPCASPDEQGRGVAAVFASYAIFPYGFMVNPATGKRFVNEWTDRKTRAEAMMALENFPVGIVDQQGLENVGEMIHEHMDEAVTRRFDSLAALADYHQLPEKALEETLQTYNSYVEKHLDEEFGKPIPAKAKPLNPPFYSVRLWPKAHSTMGGVRINPQAAVLDKAGRVIPRLYAAGEVTGGIHGVCRLGCCAITECLVFGRIAGRQAAIEEDIQEECYEQISSEKESIFRAVETISPR